MKAWVITHPETYDQHIEVVHAETRPKAIYKSHTYSDSGHDWKNIKAVREPKMDDRPVNARSFIEAGYFHTCAKCGGGMIMQDDLIDESEEADEEFNWRKNARYIGGGALVEHIDCDL